MRAAYSAQPAQPTDAAEATALLERMRGGDREAAATFITRYGARLRRRVRGKLSPSMRRLFDSQEILSTVGRRLDVYVRSGHIEAVSVNQLWALVLRIAERAVLDKVEVFHRLQRVEGEDGAFAQEFLRRLRQAESRRADVDIEIEKTLSMLADEIDRQILSMWLAGASHKQIATYVELSHDAVRQRWARIKGALHERIGEPSGGSAPG